MIVLDKTQTNTFALTLSEKVTITSPYYLMVLDGKSGQELIKWLMTDVSAYPERFNKFTFQNGVTATIPYKGDYIYTIYQKAVANLTIPTSQSDKLESGICRVTEGESSTIEHTNTTETIIHEAD